MRNWFFIFTALLSYTFGVVTGQDYEESILLKEAETLFEQVVPELERAEWTRSAWIQFTPLAQSGVGVWKPCHAASTTTERIIIELHHDKYVETDGGQSFVDLVHSLVLYDFLVLNRYEPYESYLLHATEQEVVVEVLLPEMGYRSLIRCITDHHSIIALRYDAPVGIEDAAWEACRAHWLENFWRWGVGDLPPSSMKNSF